MASNRGAEPQSRGDPSHGGEPVEQALVRMGFASPEPVGYFPGGMAVLLPGLGQWINSRYAGWQRIKGFLFAWFFWFFLLQRQLYAASAILFAASVIDFFLTRRQYNRRLAAAKAQLGYAEPPASGG